MNGPEPPQNLDSEESVLGAFMLNSMAIEKVADATTLSAEDFYRPSHGHIYRAILSLYAKGEPTDAIMVVDELAKTGTLEAAGGAERVHELAALVPAASNAAHYAKKVVDTASRRRAIRFAQDLTQKAYDGIPSEELWGWADTEVLSFHSTKSEKDSVYTGKQLAERYRYRMDHPEEFESTITPPFYFLDGQIVNGQLHVLAGYQGTGKTALLWQFAEAALEQGKKVAIWTLEMTPDQLTDRLVKAHGAEQAMEMLERWDVEIVNDSVVTPESIRRRQRKGNYDLILIDHLHRFPIKNPAHVRIEIAEMVKKLTNVALEFNVPIILLCQLSRATLHDPFPRPTTAQLKETSQIETDAAVIWFVWRKFDGFQFEYEAEFITAKHRFGSPGWQRLKFIARQVRFEPAS